MSVSEWEQTKSDHHERGMAIMNEVHDIVSAKDYLRIEMVWRNLE